jgi:hypothetical protein
LTAPDTIATPAPSPADRLTDQVGAVALPGTVRAVVARSDVAADPRRPAVAVVDGLGMLVAAGATATGTCGVSGGGPRAAGAGESGVLDSALISAVDEVSDPTRTTAAIVVPNLMSDLSLLPL